MRDNDMSRRQFLQTSSGVVAGAAAATSGTISLVASNNAWALELSTLGEHEAKTLLIMARQIFPHDSLGDIYYATVVQALDGEAGSDEATATLLKDGVSELDEALGTQWMQLSDGYQLEVLKGIAESAFFQKIKGTALVSLYNNKLIWRYFGYEGSSAEYDGYLNRGFDDLGWLPQPPDEASPEAEA